MSDITATLPHRFPFLFVDRVTESEPGKFARGYKNVSHNEWFFSGHFPNDPIMPGLLIAEAMAQMGAFAVSTSFGGGLLVSVKDLQFKASVKPGDRLDLSFEIISERGPFLTGKGVATVDGKLVARADEMLIFRQPK
ncbi:MAG: 3-hydroxyacyl-ACP dehydratase FabZ [Verrucomicrobia bacterium]|nr:3-hydroxyacyl-ACP dehydratase FabZ [Verrucomicrobiota bacterium]